MSTGEKEKWNKKYAVAGTHGSLEPEEFLVRAFQQFLTVRPPGYALDVAGGAGRHAIWLAQRGWRVKLIDIAEAGVALARENASRLLAAPANASGAPTHLVEAEVLDLNSQLDLGAELYDLVVVFLFLERRLFPALVQALKPGGLLIYQTYTLEAAPLGQGPANPQYLLAPGELLQAFQAMDLLHYRERGIAKAAAELVAKKRGSSTDRC
jgi:SAM-dependent methyltransferase